MYSVMRRIPIFGYPHHLKPESFQADAWLYAHPTLNHWDGKPFRLIHKVTPALPSQRILSALEFGAK